MEMGRGEIDQAADKTRTQIVLQERDKEALLLIYEQQFLTFDQYKREFFPNTWPQQARARLLKLERAGFIRKTLSPSLGQAQVIKLTIMGVQMMNNLSKRYVPYNQRIEHGTAIHDKFVTDIRLRLEKWVPGSVWLPERYFKGKNLEQVPDGALYYRIDDQEVSVAIEHERWTKDSDSYFRIMHKYEYDRKFNWILYVVPTIEIRDRLVRAFFEKPHKPKQNLGLVLLDDLLTGYPPFRFHDETRQVFQPPKEKATV